VLATDQVAAEWPRHLKGGRLERVVSNGDLIGGEHEKPLVLLRTARANGPRR
jgi:hypothetical protein